MWINKYRRVIYDNPGQTCNRFWAMLDSLGWAICTERKLKVLFWEPSLSEYNRLRSSQWVSFPLYTPSSEKRKWIWKFVRHGWLPQFFFWCPLTHFLLGYMKGWNTRYSKQYFPQCLDTIRSLFTPNEDVVCDIKEAYSKARQKSDLIVGVHVRHGDYATWEGGIYYYPWDKYAQFMQQIESLFCDKKISFYISSIETIPQEITDRFNIIESHKKSVATDLYGLQNADLIIGPPSTFSQWASLMGNVPLQILSNKDYLINPHAFAPITMFHPTIDKGAVILLSACINPNGMSLTALQDQKQRKIQYVDSIRYYLDNTNYPIVVCENSGTGFGDTFAKEEASGRLEILCFEGNNYDRSFGKGYGEAEILKYIFANSKLVKSCRCTIKITGRVKITNIYNVLDQMYKIKNKDFVICDANLRLSAAPSRLIVASRDFYPRFFFPYTEEINDSQGVSFEKVLAKSIREAKRHRVVHSLFKCYPFYDGVSGTFGTTIVNKSQLVRKLKYLLFKVGLWA